MPIDFDPPKNARNIAERGLPFNLIERFDWATAEILEDARRDYGETRFRAAGLIDGDLYMLVYTLRQDKGRIISLRRASRRERKSWRSRFAQT